MAEPGLAPRLIVFTDTARFERAEILMRFAELGRRATARSVLFTLRDYALTARDRLELGIAISALAARTEQRFGLADRADLALALSASAFHLPENGLSPRDARNLLGPIFLSQACHDATSEMPPDLDARLLSPIFAPRKGRPALGLSALTQSARATACEAARAPEPASDTTGRRPRPPPSARRAPLLYALGAVDDHNAAACLTAQADGIAVIAAALAPNPAPLLEALNILRSQ